MLERYRSKVDWPGTLIMRPVSDNVSALICVVALDLRLACECTEGEGLSTGKAERSAIIECIECIECGLQR